MNVTFKIMRRSGDKAYILSEITDYDKGLPVVLSASTENGVRIPCDVFPFVDEDDVLAMEFALYDTALAVRDDLLASAHAKNSPALRFVVVLPWLNVKRWVLEFRAITPEGKTQSFCVNGLEMDAFRWRNRLDIRRGAFQSEALEQLSKRFIHDRIQISFKRALDMGDRLLVSAALDMPYHEESDIAFDFLDGEGRESMAARKRFARAIADNERRNRAAFVRARRIKTTPIGAHRRKPQSNHARQGSKLPRVGRTCPSEQYGIGRIEHSYDAAVENAKGPHNARTAPQGSRPLFVALFVALLVHIAGTVSAFG